MYFAASQIMQPILVYKMLDVLILTTPREVQSPNPYLKLFRLVCFRIQKYSDLERRYDAYIYMNP